jgi:hypothetical protein
MWTLIRFALNSDDTGPYRAAFELLGEAGFVRHQSPDDAGAEATFPAAVVADVPEDPAVVSRAVFDALAAARLRPIMVTGCHLRGRAVRREPALASA